MSLSTTFRFGPVRVDFVHGAQLCRSPLVPAGDLMPPAPPQEH